MSWIPSYKKKVPPPEPYVPCEWSTGTDEEIIEALEKHYAGQVDLHDYWSVGDTRQITLDAMSATGVGESHAQQTVTFVLSHVGGKYLVDGVTECCFQVDQVNSLNERGYINSSNTNTWYISARHSWCNSVYYNAIPSTIKPIFKQFIVYSGKGGETTSGVNKSEDYFSLRAEKEIFGSTTYSVNGEGTQVSWYETSSNRIKQVNGSNFQWWERSPRSMYGNQYCYVNASGTGAVITSTSNLGIAPFGVI